MQDRHQDIRHKHRPDSQRQPADRADERQHDAAHRKTADQEGRMIRKVRRKRQNRHHIRIKSAHVHTDSHRRKPDRNDNQRRRDAAGRGRNRRICRENTLDIRLRAKDADNHREQIRHRHLEPASEKIQMRRRNCHGRRSQHLICFETADEKGKPDDSHLEDAPDGRTLHPAKKRIRRDKRHQDDCRWKLAHAEDRGNDFHPGQAARHRRKKNPYRRNHRRQTLRPPPVMHPQKLRNRRKPRRAHFLCIENPHQDESNPASQSEPPCRKPHTVRQLRRTHRRTAADHRPGNPAGHHGHPGTPSADTVSLSRPDLARLKNSHTDDKSHRQKHHGHQRPRHMHGHSPLRK